MRDALEAAFLIAIYTSPLTLLTVYMSGFFAKRQCIRVAKKYGHTVEAEWRDGYLAVLVNGRNPLFYGSQYPGNAWRCATRHMIRDLEKIPYPREKVT